MNLPRRYKEIFNRYNREIAIVEKKVRNFEIKREKLIRREEYATEFEVNEIETRRRTYEEEEEIEKEYFKKSEFYIDKADEVEESVYEEVDIDVDDDYGMNAEDVVKALSLLKDETQDEFWDDIDILDNSSDEDIEYDEELLDDDLLYLDDLDNNIENIGDEEYEEYDEEYDDYEDEYEEDDE